MLHGTRRSTRLTAGPGCAVGTEVAAVAFEGFIDEAAAAEDDPPSPCGLWRAGPVAEVTYTTAQCLSLREGAAGVEDGLDGFGAESGFGVFG